MTIRMRVLPRFPAMISGVSGITTTRDGTDIVIKSDYGALVRIPAVADASTSFFKVWDSNLNSYSIMTFGDVFAAVAAMGFMDVATYDPQGKHADAFARANHTGTQAISTVSGLQAALDAKLALAGGTMTGAILDAVFAPSSANTKKVQFDNALITAGQTRSIKVPDADVALSKWELIGDYTVSAAASLAVTNLSAFRKLRISGKLITSAATTLNMRTSTNNGSSYDSGASDYAYQLSYTTGATQTSSGSTSSSVMFAAPSNNDVGGAITFEQTIEGFNKAEVMGMRGTAAFIIAGVFGLGAVAGQRNIATAKNAFQLFPGTGTITGSVTVEGVRG